MLYVQPLLRGQLLSDALSSRETTPRIIRRCNTLIQVKVTIWIGKLLRTLLKGNTFIDSYP